MVDGTEALDLQKYGLIPVDPEYWERLFDEEHGQQYDDLAHFGLTRHDQDEYRRAVLDYEDGLYE